jgi:hypothetical protein
VPWECVLDLVERGAQISLKNRAGVRPADLAPSCLLARLQVQMLSDCWSGLGAGSCTASAMVHQSSIGLDNSGNYSASVPAGTAVSTAARSTHPARILRKFRTASGTTALRTESTEEASSASAEMLALSSTGSVRSRISRHSLEVGALAGNNSNNNKVRVTLCFQIHPVIYPKVSVKSRGRVRDNFENYRMSWSSG